MPSVSSSTAWVAAVASRLDKVGGAELEGQLLALGVSTEGDDPLGTEPSRGKDRAQPDRSIADDRHRVAPLDPGADRGVVPGGHDVRQCQQGLEHVVGMARPRNGDQRGAGQRDPHDFSLAAIDLSVSEVPTLQATQRGPVQAVWAGHVAENERGDHEVTDGNPPTSAPTASTTPMNS